MLDFDRKSLKLFMLGAVPKACCVKWQVVFDYTAYNEQGRRIDTTYSKGAPARTRIGIQGLIPGAAELSDVRVLS